MPNNKASSIQKPVDAIDRPWGWMQRVQMSGRCEIFKCFVDVDRGRPYTSWHCHRRHRQIVIPITAALAFATRDSMGREIVTGPRIWSTFEVGEYEWHRLLFVSSGLFLEVSHAVDSIPPSIVLDTHREDD